MPILSYIKIGLAATVIIVIAILYGLWQHEKAAAQAANDALAVAQRINNENVAQIEKIKADAAAADAALRQELANRDKQLEQKTWIETGISHAKPVDKGNVPRVVLGAIDRLYKPAGGGPDKGSATSHPRHAP